MRTLTFLLLAGALTVGHTASPVDRVVVKKSEMVLELRAGDLVIRKYPIYLGGNPVGHKQKQGDRRTPEGRYRLDARNANSRYYRALRVSYPSKKDQHAATERGDRPGGDIMIHGMPDDLDRRNQLMFSGRHWTDGCIALSNPHMKEVWTLVGLNVPVDIQP